MVKILGYEFLKSDTLQDIQKQTTELRKEVLSLENKLAETRPSLDYLEQMGTEGVRAVILPVDMRSIYEVADYSDIIRNIRIALKTEIFRNGWIFEEKFVSKCAVCDEEFDYEVEKCPKCFNSKIIHPDNRQIKELEETFKDKINLNNQNLLDVCESFEDDLNIMDDAYLIIVKDYVYNGEGAIIGAKVREIIRGNPVFMRVVTDKEGTPARNEQGQRVFVCPEHRESLVIDRRTCPICQKVVYPAYYAAIGLTTEKEKIFYMEDEIIHVSKYSPSLTYGFPPILSVWNKIWALMFMDRYFRAAFQRQRPPKGILLVATRAVESLWKAWDWLTEKVRKEPHGIYPLGIETDKTGSFAQFIDLMRPLTELQYIEARNEMRRAIGACYGVMPLFMADVTVSGGLNQEGLQITVTNRAIAKSQSIYNEKVFPRLLKQFAVTDFVLRLEPSEEIDEMAELQRENLEIQNARLMKDLGFTIKRNERGEFEYEEPEEGIKPIIPEGRRAEGLGMQTTVLPRVPAQRFTAEPESVRRSMEVTKDEEEKVVKDIIFKRKFKGLSKWMSDRVKNYLTEAARGKFLITDMIRAITKLTKNQISEEEAERIVRTEHHAIRNALREFNYRKSDPKGELKYRAINPMDDRTTQVCKNIVRRSRNGVALKRLKQIFKEESIKGGFKGERTWTPHPNCRTVCVRIV